MDIEFSKDFCCLVYLFALLYLVTMGSALVLFRSKWKVDNMFRKQARGFWKGCYTKHRSGS